MKATPETVRRVLRSWLATEVLTPQVTRNGWSGLAAEKQGQQRNRQSTTADDPGLWADPGDDDPPPWSLLAEPAEPGAGDAYTSETSAEDKPSPPSPWFFVVLGALPAREAFARLDAAFADDADEDETNRRSRGHVIGACAVLDQWGVLVPDTLAIASFAWGLGHIVSGGAASDLAAWDDQEQDLRERFGHILTPMGASGVPRSLTWRDLRAVSLELAKELRLPSELWLVTPCAIRMVRQNPPGADILSSFLLPDLGRVLRDAGHLPDAAASYLGLRPPARRWDALADRVQLSSLLQPASFPLGRWPGPGLHSLTLLQQAAVSAVVRDLGRTGLAAVNGPPGTGKTTLLRDVVAHVMVSRAERLSALELPLGELTGLDLMDSSTACSNWAARTPSVSPEYIRGLWYTRPPCGLMQRRPRKPKTFRCLKV